MLRGRVALVVGVTMLLVGCGGDDSTTGTTVDEGDTTTVEASAAESSPSATSDDEPTTVVATPASIAAADGPPIVIGITSATNNPIFSDPELFTAAAAAAEYVNEELGGVQGHPIELAHCETNNTAESSVACATELLQRHPVAVIAGPDVAMPAALSIYEQAGVPVIGGGSVAPPEFSSPVRVLFHGWSASVLPSMVYFASTQFDASKVVVLAPDDPSVTATVVPLMEQAAQRFGMEKPDVITVPTGSADMTPQMAAAANTGADVIMAVSLPCGPVAQAYHTVGADQPMVQPGSCSNPRDLENLGDSAEGLYFTSMSRRPDVDHDDHDAQLFADVTERFGDDIPITDFSLVGFSSMMNIHSTLDAAPDVESLDSTSLLALFQGGSGHNFMGNEWNCTAPAVAVFPALCDISSRLLQVVDGALVEVAPFVDGSTLYGDG